MIDPAAVKDKRQIQMFSIVVLVQHLVFFMTHRRVISVLLYFNYTVRQTCSIFGTFVLQVFFCINIFQVFEQRVFAFFIRLLGRIIPHIILSIELLY